MTCLKKRKNQSTCHDVSAEESARIQAIGYINLILVRHGLTAENKQGQYVGRSDPPLIQAGREALAQLPETDPIPSVTQIISSPLQRCLESATLLWPGRAVKSCAQLVERDFGLWEGKSWADLKDDPAYRRFIDTRGRIAPGHVESLTSFSGRIRSFLSWAATHFAAGETIAVVTHGGCLMEIAHQLGCTGDYYDFQLQPGTWRMLELPKSFR